MAARKIALTGSIACGKSAIVQFLRELDVPVLDADDVVHELEAPGGAAVEAIAARFGTGVLDSSGGVDRRRLAAIVFSEGGDGARRDLEAILHPLVRERLRSFEGVSAVPLLFESGWDGDFDKVVCVTSPKELQVKRMVETRGYSPEQAHSRIAAQMPQELKASKSDFIIDNSGSLDDLRLAAIDLKRRML